MNEETLENKHIIFKKIDGLLYSEYKGNCTLDKKTAEEIIETRHQISNNEKQYWLHDIKNLKTITAEGRNYADIHGQEFLFASAILIHSHVQKFIFNAYLALKKPKIHFNFFTDKEKAIKWLIQLKNNSK